MTKKSKGRNGLREYAFFIMGAAFLIVNLGLYYGKKNEQNFRHTECHAEGCLLLIKSELIIVLKLDRIGCKAELYTS